MEVTKKAATKSRFKKLAVAGAAAAMLLTGTAVALSNTDAFAVATAASMTASSAKNAATGTQTVVAGDKVTASASFSGLQTGARYYYMSKIVDKATGKELDGWYGAPFNALASSDTVKWTYPVPANAAGKDIVVFNYIFHNTDVEGPLNRPTSVKRSAIALNQNLNNAAATLSVAAANTAAPAAATAVNTTASANTSTAANTTTAAAAAGISTVATDKADGDKIVQPGGVIVDKVSYTNLHVGTVYVLQTELFDKTTGQIVKWTGLKVFTPNTKDGVETVEIPVPKGAEGHTFVVFQTIWAGADALVGKHLDKIQVRPGAIPAAKEDDPNNPDQTVSVPSPEPQGCTISGYVWKDANKNGVMDANEAKVPGVSVALRRLAPGQDNFPGTAVDLPAQVTDANGFYKFVVPANQCGRFFVDFNESQYPELWVPFSGGDSDLKGDNLTGGWTNPFTIVPGQNMERVDAGLREIPNECTISGYVWKDDDWSGAMEGHDAKVGGVKVTLRRLNDAKNDFPGTLVNVAEQTTDKNGWYGFKLPGDQCGNFFVDFNEGNYPDGYKGFHGGSSWLKPGDVDSGWTNAFTVKRGEKREFVNAGLRGSTGTVVGNYCGSGDASGYSAWLINSNTGHRQALKYTNSRGQLFKFDNVPAGRYHVYLEDHQRAFGTVRFMRKADIAWEQAQGAGAWSYNHFVRTGHFNVGANGWVNLTMCVGAINTMISPIGLDLNGSGQINTSNVADQTANAKFDLLGTGTAVKSGWVAKGDGLLVEPNADGSVTDINNLFGGSLGEGYAKLAKRDANNDGVLTGAELKGLKAWVDANGDHQAQAGELHLLSKYGITSINTKFVNQPVSNNGNAVIEHSNATTAFGQKIVMGDAYFAVDTEGHAANEAAVAAGVAKTNAKLETLPEAEANEIRNAFSGLK